jgi:hypothetical protein
MQAPEGEVSMRLKSILSRRARTPEEIPDNYGDALAMEVLQRLDRRDLWDWRWQARNHAAALIAMGAVALTAAGLLLVRSLAVRPPSVWTRSARTGRRVARRLAAGPALAQLAFA